MLDERRAKEDSRRYPDPDLVPGPGVCDGGRPQPLQPEHDMIAVVNQEVFKVAELWGLVLR
jgi:hypothetical protein